ncbi:unnamed protein product [Cyclocybe aegerita]|uniref:Uncharacterized protein n=1 Tax=Cyclocybe aegerita TaxID=1973307 RepID=A0A8S0WBG0_CYCAE|nr:unnamed protein product [Cyclocybe aegerita]
MSTAQSQQDAPSGSRDVEAADRGYGSHRMNGDRRRRRSSSPRESEKLTVTSKPHPFWSTKRGKGVIALVVLVVIGAIVGGAIGGAIGSRGDSEPDAMNTTSEPPYATTTASNAITTSNTPGSPDVVAEGPL